METFLCQRIDLRQARHTAPPPKGTHTKVDGDADNCSSESILAMRITPFMFNCRFHMAKRPLRQDMAACIAFWRIATPKVGHLLPESLQRF